MLSWITSIFDFILPLKDRSARTKARLAQELHPTPTTHELLGSTIVTLFEYHDPTVEDAIRALKYEDFAPATKLLADALSEYLQEEIAHIRSFSVREILIVPVPLHEMREKERGFNQITRILKALPSELQNGARARLAVEVLVRIRETIQQTKLSRNDRLSNVAGAFSVSTSAEVSNAHVILVDDVTTTGATLVNASTPLRKAGAEVTLIAIARA